MALQKLAPLDLSSFDISAARGFLPRRDPLATLPHRWPAFLNDLAQALPKLLAARQLRSEEHTSELQSRPHLVCRLLLEKKKNNSLITGLFIVMRRVYRTRPRRS